MKIDDCPPKMRPLQENRFVKLRALIAAFFFCAIFAGFTYSRLIPRGLEVKAEEVKIDTTPVESAVKYNKFPHSKHRRQTCATCHKFPSANWKKVRKDPFPDITDYPKHESCLSCHRRQFFGSPRPAICTICHTNPSPRNSTRHPFANPREVFDQSAKGRNAESQFEISFPHATHTDLVGDAGGDEHKTKEVLFRTAAFRKRAAAEESCSVCHQTYRPQGDEENEYMTQPPKDLGDAFWLKKGTFKTVPRSHQTCFTCHSTDTGISPVPQDCGTCHKLKQKAPPTDFEQKVASPMKITDKVMMLAWRKRDSSAKYRHEFFAHVDMDCASCHTVDSMNTVVAATKKVSISSCALCHVTETSDDGGILNFEVDSRKADPKFQCVKCHIAFGKLPVPGTHLEAIRAAAGN